MRRRGFGQLIQRCLNHLVVPVGRPLRFHLTSTTVKNSFLVPQLGSQIYTMAGMTTELNLRADRAGVYPGLSAQFSGDGFSDMRFEVEAVSEEAFAGWLAATAAEGRPLDAEALPLVGFADDTIDAAIDVTAHLPAKLAALRAHATQVQVAPDGTAMALSNNIALPVPAVVGAAIGALSSRNGGRNLNLILILIFFYYLTIAN